jgi:hypothetical protein
MPFPIKPKAPAAKAPAKMPMKPKMPAAPPKKAFPAKKPMPSNKASVTKAPAKATLTPAMRREIVAIVDRELAKKKG